MLWRTSAGLKTADIDKLLSHCSVKVLSKRAKHVCHDHRDGAAISRWCGVTIRLLVGQRIITAPSLSHLQRQSRRVLRSC